jgi:hypothetical protein
MAKNTKSGAGNGLRLRSYPSVPEWCAQERGNLVERRALGVHSRNLIS